MKYGIALVSFFMILPLYPELVDQAVFHTPDGTQIILLSDIHNPTSERDEAQTDSLLKEVQDFAYRDKRSLRVLVEEPSRLYKKEQEFPAALTTIRSKIRRLRNNLIHAENAELRSAAMAARFLLQGAPKKYLTSKLDAKKLYQHRKLSSWGSLEKVTLLDVFNELHDAIQKLKEKTTAAKKPIKELEKRLTQLRAEYEYYFNTKLSFIVDCIGNETSSDLLTKLLGDVSDISDRIFEQYLLARTLQKSKKSNVILVAGREHINVIRGLLQHEACSLRSFKKYNEASKIVLDRHTVSRLRTWYLKMVRAYLACKRNYLSQTKLLNRVFKDC